MLKTLLSFLAWQNKYFRMYMKDKDNATKYQASRDMDGLHLYCNNQVNHTTPLRYNLGHAFRRIDILLFIHGYDVLLA